MAKSISFALIRSKNPHIENADDIELVDSINLTGCQLSYIDNLELFSHINELNLSNNNITRIENLFFFKSLKLLDVSFNNIDSVSLEQSIKEIPASLLSINLTGNPCASDENALGKLLDAFPDLAIAIEVDDGTRNISVEESDGKNRNEEEEDEEDFEEMKTLPRVPELGAGPLNADEILKSIVDRKCKIQSFNTMSIDKVVTDLNTETEQLILESTNKRLQMASKFAESAYSSSSFDERIATLRKRNEDSSNDVKDMIYKMKATVEAKLKSKEMKE